MPEIVRIPLKGGTYKEIDLDDLQADDFPVEVFKLLLCDGLQVRLNGGMTKFKVKDLEPDELAEAQEEIKKRADENWQALCEGKIKTTKKGVGKVPGAVKTRAMQIAKALAKDAIRRAGHKASAYTAAEIKEMAEEILTADPSIVTKAAAQLAELETTGKEQSITLPERFAHDESRKAKPRGKPVAALAAAKRKREGAAARN